jgi:hypothetical protein
MVRQVIALLGIVALMSVVGCASGLASAEGVVTLDGTPVEGATVSFVPVDDTVGRLANGRTDSSGRFRLSTSGKPGAKPGDYKVTVIKVKAVEGGENLKPGTDETKKFMEGKGKAMAPPKPGGPGAGAMGRPGMPGGPGAGGGPKSELPAIYASGNTTPLSQTIPAGGPIKLELESKKK